MARASRTSQARAARQAKMLYDMCAMMTSKRRQLFFTFGKSM